MDISLDAARGEFDAEVVYLNTATLGLPPRRSWLALQDALRAWRAGTSDPAGYDLALAGARAAYARLVGTNPSGVAVGSQVSVFAGLVAASLPGGSEVVTVSGDFTSILFPFHVQAPRGVVVREVPLERLPEAVTARTALVSMSAVQSADGPRPGAPRRGGHRRAARARRRARRPLPRRARSAAGRLSHRVPGRRR